MTYRGIHGMEVHLYRWGELKRELRGAGFRIDEVIPLEDVTYQPIPPLAPSPLPRGGLDRLRAQAWVAGSSRRPPCTLTADFRGRENNQAFGGQAPRFSGDFVRPGAPIVDCFPGPIRLGRLRIYILRNHDCPDASGGFLPAF